MAKTTLMWNWSNPRVKPFISILYVFSLLVILWVLFSINRQIDHAALDDTNQLRRIQEESRKYGLTPKEKVSVRQLLRQFRLIARQTNVTYCLYGGTLLGQYRFNNILPWDDDIDLAMRWEDHFKFAETVKRLNTSLKTYLNANSVLKLWDDEQWSVQGVPDWKWPFIDIFLWEEKPKPEDSVLILFDAITIEKKSLFPTRTAPFMGLNLPIPQNSSNILERLYGGNFSRRCVTGGWDHRREIPINHARRTIDCSQLHGFNPNPFP